MASYKTMYLKMFNVVSDVEQQLQQISETLRTMQQECEEMYINADNAPIPFPIKQTNQEE